MAKTRLLPLKAGFQGERNTLKSRYQIVTKYALKWPLPVCTGAKFILLKGTALQ
jgi:hypothetical protein